MKTNRLQIVKKAVRIVPFLLLALLLTQCRGPKGDNGLDGINYTSSVIYDVSSSSWAGDVNGYKATINVPEINDDIYYNGAVLVYRLVEINPKSFNMLPYTYVDNTYTVYMDFDAFVGSIDLIFKEVDNGANVTAAPESTMSFKVVIIEGISLAVLKSTVDVRDYNAVSKLLNLDKNRWPVE